MAQVLLSVLATQNIIAACHAIKLYDFYINGHILWEMLLLLHEVLNLTSSEVAL